MIILNKIQMMTSKMIKIILELIITRDNYIKYKLKSD